MVIKKVIVEKANRLFKMPPPLLPFSETERTRMFLRRTDVLDLAGFRWPVTYTEEMQPEPDQLLPASSREIEQTKENLAAWLSERWGTTINPDKELYLGGSITSLIHQLTLALLDPGDVAFVPEVAVPLYRRAVTAVGAEAIGYEMSAKTDWRPQFDRLNTRLGRVARMLFVNSPHNPTGVELSEKDLTDLAWLAGRENVLVVNDCAYAGIPSQQPTSLMSIRGGRRVGVEVYSLPYLLGLPPMPLGFVVGHREVISALRPLTRLAPAAVTRHQLTLIARAIQDYPSAALMRIRQDIARRSAEAVKLVEALGARGTAALSVPYLWAQLERRTSSTHLARQLYKRHRILVAPGLSFGDNGEGFVRCCLTADAEVYVDAVRRVSRRKLIKRKGSK
ncbi:aminotransferase class I/II-fold pyridoxal phosphate-dependent enzyme [candidate division GN15 bacterium]|nr:aminotransferase class I/II-fold pyridoxal phosphate-dependent enzyme [candidate division GN15 bacterium]